MIICKEFIFESAHKLLNYSGKCANLHGHTYRLQVFISGQVKKNGLVMDFLDLKKIVENKVISQLDHHYLNDIIKQPTAENISEWIWNRLKNEIFLYEVRLWETPTSFVIYNGKSD